MKIWTFTIIFINLKTFNLQTPPNVFVEDVCFCVTDGYCPGATNADRGLKITILMKNFA